MTAVVDLGRVRRARAALDKVAEERPDLVAANAASVAEWLAELEQWDGSMTEDVKAYGLAEVGAMLGVHPETVRRAIRKGELAACNLGKDYRVSRLELAKWWASKGGGRLFDEVPLEVRGAEEALVPKEGKGPASPKRKGKA